MGVEIREYQSTDRGGVTALLREVFGSDRSFLNVENGNPLGKCLMAVAVVEGEVVGYNHWVPWHLGGRREQYGYQSGATAVAPAARGQNIFRRLLREGDRQGQEVGAPFFFGFPNGNSLPGFLKEGWSHDCTLRAYAIPGTALRRRPISIPEGYSPFVAWRLAMHQADCAGGTTGIVQSRGEGAAGRLVRVLDYTAPEGDRQSVGLWTGISGTLPIGKIGLLRTQIQGPRALLVPRTAGTPFIVKRFFEGPRFDLPLMFGDIDAG